ncbi:MAG: sigma-70 family RNA polymerase sigma factor [Clostridia bacterium]|nr:sigma-70 family RNA polymerase sigma factor [Clostridia bacterium]
MIFGIYRFHSDFAGETTEQLVSRIQAGDPDSEALKEAVLKRVSRLIDAKLSRYSGYFGVHADIDDFRQEIYLQTLRTITKYEPTHNAKFATYLSTCIDGVIKNLLNKRSSLHVSREIIRLNRKISKAIAELSVSLGREPTVAEIADNLNRSVEEVLFARELPVITSMEEDPNDDEDTSRYDMIGEDDPNFERVELFIDVKKALMELSKEDRKIFIMYLRGMNQTEIARHMGVYQVSISRKLDKIKKMLRQKFI